MWTDHDICFDYSVSAHTSFRGAVVVACSYFDLFETLFIGKHTTTLLPTAVDATLDLKSSSV